MDKCVLGGDSKLIEKPGRDSIARRRVAAHPLDAQDFRPRARPNRVRRHTLRRGECKMNVDHVPLGEIRGFELDVESPGPDVARDSPNDMGAGHAILVTFHRQPDIHPLIAASLVGPVALAHRSTLRKSPSLLQARLDCRFFTDHGNGRTRPGGPAPPRLGCVPRTLKFMQFSRHQYACRRPGHVPRPNSRLSRPDRRSPDAVAPTGNCPGPASILGNIGLPHEAWRPRGTSWPLFGRPTCLRGNHCPPLHPMR